MTEATVHALPAETTITEDVSNLMTDLKRYFHRNGDAFLMLGLTAASLLANRAILRRELKRLSFNIELYPDDEWGDYGNDRFDDE